MIEFAFMSFTTLFVIVDPIGLIPIFLSLTSEMTSHQRARTALWATVMAAGILIGSAILGQRLLELFGISLAAFRIAGGMMLFYTAFEMVFENRQKRRSARADIKVDDGHIRELAAFPLAIPLLAGPGAITACILLAGQPGVGPLSLFVLIVVIMVISALALLAFIAAQPLNAYLGETGKILLTRLLGVLLAALAVQFVVDGVIDTIKMRLPGS
ncbi:MAG: MarC family protein [Pseudomonadota bacterium]